MIVLGSNSDISKSFVEKMLDEGNRFPIVYLVTSNEVPAQKFAQHIFAKYEQKCEVVVFDLLTEDNYSKFDNIESELVFCASGFLGLDAQSNLYNHENTEKIVTINYSKLIVLLNHLAKKLEQKGKGTIIALSSVAGERGRQSNFIYGSAKAGFTTYLAGLRNYMFHKGVHVLTVIPGFMDTQMTAEIETPKPLTIDPKVAANLIYKAYKRKKNTVYISFIWQIIMMVIKMIPEFIFKKLKM